MTPQLHTRNATLDDLAGLLKAQHDAKIDVVAPATAIRSEGGVWYVEGTDGELNEQTLEVVATAGAFVPTAQADEHIAAALKIPLAYLRTLRTDRPDLYDANVNGWLQGYVGPDSSVTDENVIPADPRSFLVRLFAGNGDGPGVARALLSSRYKAMDHLDVLTAALDGVAAAGVNVDIDGCDLSDRKMYVRLVAPEVQALAPALLRGYRSPFDSRPADELPVVFAGLVLSNSETGGGAFSIAPRLMVQVCRNGMVRTMDAIRAIHIGGKLDDGVVDWSAATLTKTLELVTSQATDAVTTFLSPGYVERVIAEAEAAAAVPLTDAVAQVQVVTSRLRIGEERSRQILDHFIKGGQLTAGGLGQAVASVARTVDNADDAAEMEAQVFAAIDTAALVGAS